MDDLTSTIASILNDPQKMEQLRGVAQSLGINTDAPAAGASSAEGNAAGTSSAPAFDPAVLSQILGNLQGMGQGGGSSGQSSNGSAANAGQSSTGQTSGQGSGGLFSASSLSTLADIMQTFNSSDKNVNLLRSLKPHFSDARAGRIDDAVRILQILRTWPKVRDSGLLGSLGNFLGGGGSGGGR